MQYRYLATFGSLGEIPPIWFGYGNIGTLGHMQT